MNKPSTFEKWYPVTNDFGLIEAPLGLVSDAYQEWWVALGKDFEVQQCCGNLDQQLSQLAPLSAAVNRMLLLPTSSRWTAFFRNGIQGSDPSSAMPVLAKQLDVRAMRVCSTGSKPKYPGVIWEVYDPQATCGNVNCCRRSIAAVNDGGRWVFEQYGDPYTFEKTERYLAGMKRDRFNHELLLEYVSHFGISTLGDELFETANREGTLISRPYFDHIPKYTLEETCAGLPWKR